MNTEQRANSARGSLREEQKERTRERILAGLVKTMARGVADLSVPAVAREAGVSVPTVYRYFRTKRDLVAAVPGYFAQQLGVREVRPPRNPDELAAMVQEIYAQADGMDETLQAALVSEMGTPIVEDLRRTAMPYRLRMVEDALAPVTQRMDDADCTRLRDVVLVLSSSAALRAFKDYLGISFAEAAADVAWAIRTLARAAAT